MCIVQLALILRLDTVLVEGGIDRICIGRLFAAIELHAAKYLVVLAEVIVHARR